MKIIKASKIQSCYIGPQISPEEFIAEHFFLFLNKGRMEGYDGSRHYVLNPGESCIVRKNQLARYNKQKQNNEFEKVIVIFDEPFLRSFLIKNKANFKAFASPSAFLRIKKNKYLVPFLESLEITDPADWNTNKESLDQKREELLSIILKLHPEYASIFFDFGKPGKIDLKEFMSKNYKFNVSVERLAFLSGRSLSAFKRDFTEIFNQTPNRWLVERRLQEARFLIEKKRKKVTDFYLDLGFEDLSHFSFAFKKQFGLAPTALLPKAE